MGKKNIRFTDIVLYGRDCGKMIPLTSDPLGEFVREKCFLFRLIPDSFGSQQQLRCILFLF